MNVAIDHSELQSKLKEAIEASDAQRAWALLTPYEGELGADRELTKLWLELLRLTPDRPSLMGEVELVLSRMGGDAEIVIAANAALLSAAARRAPDERRLPRRPCRWSRWADRSARGAPSTAGRRCR